MNQPKGHTLSLNIKIMNSFNSHYIKMLSLKYTTQLFQATGYFFRKRFVKIVF